MVKSVNHHRHSIRYRDFDYASEGGYFVTVVSHQGRCLFGEIVDGVMRLNIFGRVVWKEWFITSQLRPNIELFEDEFVVMPNHIHGIIWITNSLDGGRGTLQRAPTVERFGKPVSNSIPTIVRLFKATVTRQINVLRNTPAEPVWQRNYYEHIIIDERDYQNISEYISNNPLGWETDTENNCKCD